jgi:hypothetical protein
MEQVIKITWKNRDGKLASLRCSNTSLLAEILDSCLTINEPGLTIQVEREGSGDGQDT